MCDYSLLGVPNRLACEGEDLVVSRFKTGSLGLTPCASTERTPWPPGWWGRARAILRTLGARFASLTTEPVAVCIPPGAQLLLCDIPQHIQRACCIGPIEEVVFTQLTATPYEYRDAVRFQNGQETLLQELQPGQRVHVLRLSLAEEAIQIFDDPLEDFFPRQMRVDLIAPRSLCMGRSLPESDHD